MFLRERGPNNLIGSWPIVIAVGPPVVLLALWIVFADMFSHSWWRFSILLVGLVSLLFMAQYAFRLRRRLDRADGQLCAYCRYSLKDLPAPGRCPECGQDFPADRFESVWRRHRYMLRNAPSTVGQRNDKDIGTADPQ